MLNTQAISLVCRKLTRQKILKEDGSQNKVEIIFFFARCGEFPRVLHFDSKHCKGDVLGCHRGRDGRIISILLNTKDVTMNLVCIYAPTQDRCQQQIAFIVN